jgi:hypothetical protein
MKLDRNIVVIHGGYYIGFSKENFRVYEELITYYNLDILDVVIFTWDTPNNLEYFNNIRNEFAKHPKLKLHVIQERYDGEFYLFCKGIQSHFIGDATIMKTVLTRRVMRWYIISRLVNYVENKFPDSYSMWIGYKNFKFRNYNFITKLLNIPKNSIQVQWAKLDERGVKDTFFFALNSDMSKIFPFNTKDLVTNVVKAFEDGMKFYNFYPHQFNKFLRTQNESYATSYNLKGKVFWKGAEIFYFLLKPFFTSENFVQLGMYVTESDYPLPRVEFFNGEVSMYEIKPIPGKDGPLDSI